MTRPSSGMPLRRLLTAAGFVVALLTVVVLGLASRRASTTSLPTRPISSAAATTPTSATPAGIPEGAAAADLARLSQAPLVAPAPRSEAITGEVAQQPDLYAAEFVRRLLTQDYTQPRGALLSWVQLESATTSEPLVVGLVPPALRPRMAVDSVTDTTNGPAPIPTPAEWTALARQRAWTTVTIDRVVEPLAWSNAVAAGRVTDPGITGREVAATLTRHTPGPAGSTTDARFSVAIALNLEGPPARASWWFVTAVTYTVVPMGAS